MWWNPIDGLVSTLSILRNSRLARNVAVVASGAVAAQAINMCAAPFLTRLYGPDAFGILGAFVAITGVLNPVVALGYPLAIVLEKNDEDASSVAMLSVCIAMVTTGFVAMAIALMGVKMSRHLQLEPLGELLWLIPPALLGGALLQVMTQHVTRNNLFALKAKTVFTQAFVVNATKLGIGSLYPIAAVLVVISTVGTLLHGAILYACVRPLNSRPTYRIYRIWEMALRHRDFLLYRAPQDLINAASQSAPVLLLTSLFGPAPAGFYALGRLVLGVPAALVAQSFGEVFYPRIAAAARTGESRSQLILRSTLALVAIGIAPFSLVVFFGPPMFATVFGHEWQMAGEYARWLSLMLFFNFINRPSVAAVPVLGLQRGLLIYELFSTGSKLIALYVGFVMFASDLVAVAAFSLVGATAYFLLIAWVINQARFEEKKNLHA